MQEISSKIDVLGKKYIENYASMKKIISELESHFELSKTKEVRKKLRELEKEINYLQEKKSSYFLIKINPSLNLCHWLV